MKHIIEYLILTILILVLITFNVPKQIIIDNSMYVQVFTMIIFFITCIITVINFKYGIEDRKKMTGINYSNLTQSKIHEIDKLFMMNPLLDRLYLEMYKGDPTIINMKKYSPSDLTNIDNNYMILKAEHHASNLIFQTIADVYMCEIYPKSHDNVKEWITTFTGWLKSPVLQKHWKYLNREYNNDVVIFINKLIIN